MAINIGSLRQRVAAGAAFLDKKFKDWFKKINVDTLNMNSNTACILGQLALSKKLKSAFTLGRKMGLYSDFPHWRDCYHLYGFQVDHSNHKRQIGYWKQEIDSRLKAAKPKKAATKEVVGVIAKKPTKRKAKAIVGKIVKKPTKKKVKRV